jgi:hypothetical protein
MYLLYKVSFNYVLFHPQSQASVFFKFNAISDEVFDVGKFEEDFPEKFSTCSSVETICSYGGRNNTMLKSTTRGAS